MRLQPLLQSQKKEILLNIFTNPLPFQQSRNHSDDTDNNFEACNNCILQTSIPQCPDIAMHHPHQVHHYTYILLEECRYNDELGVGGASLCPDIGEWKFAGYNYCMPQNYYRYRQNGSWTVETEEDL